MRNLFLAIFVVCFSKNLSAQEVALVQHKVKLGETVKMISVKYRVNPTEIYKLNPDAVNGVSQGMVLQMYVPKYNDLTTERVLPVVETTTESDNEAVEIKTKTQKVVAEIKPEKQVIEQQLVSQVEDTSAASATIKHVVQAKETLYSLTRTYNVTLEQLKAQNPFLKNKGLQIGQTITINPDK